MVNYKKIQELGEKLRSSNKEEISVDALFQLLRIETGSHRDKTLRHYTEILVSEGFIRVDSWHAIYMGIGVVDIIRNGKELKK
uniref:Uncharacterized protein n=1 Tax=viral metagenome TaxID=1070528 RepID=A0A6M3X6E0_9ZZZZ